MAAWGSGSHFGLEEGYRRVHRLLGAEGTGCVQALSCETIRSRGVRVLTYADDGPRAGGAVVVVLAGHRASSGRRSIMAGR